MSKIRVSFRCSHQCMATDNGTNLARCPAKLSSEAQLAKLGDQHTHGDRSSCLFAEVCHVTTTFGAFCFFSIQKKLDKYTAELTGPGHVETFLSSYSVQSVWIFHQLEISWILHTLSNKDYFLISKMLITSHRCRPNCKAFGTT